MTRDEILAVLDRRREALLQRDWTVLGELYGEFARTESPLTGTAVGREAISKGVESFFSAFPDVILTDEPPLIDGDRAAIVSEVTGTHMGTILGLAPTGRSFRIPATFVFTFRDGQIVHERRIYDFTGLLVQIGVLKAKPA